MHDTATDLNEPKESCQQSFPTGLMTKTLIGFDALNFSHCTVLSLESFRKHRVYLPDHLSCCIINGAAVGVRANLRSLTH